MSQQRTKAPTIIDIAVEAGVSKSAVSRALLGQGEVSPETRERVENAANKLGYVANAMARGLVSSSTKTLGVVLRDVTRPFYGALYAAMQARAEQSGYRIVTSTSAGELNVAGALGALRSLVSLQVDGLIIASAQLPSERIVPFVKRVPIVVAGRKESHPTITSVYCDDVEGGALLADHLMQRGHRKIAVAIVDKNYSLSQHTRGISMIDRIREGGGEPVPFTIPDDSSVRDAVDAVIDQATISALMCPTDMAMMDALDQLRLRGKSAPADLSITGYDGLGPLASPFLGLTTFRQPIEEIGHTSIDLLMQAVEGSPDAGQHIALSGHVLEGRTTRWLSGVSV